VRGRMGAMKTTRIFAVGMEIPFAGTSVRDIADSRVNQADSNQFKPFNESPLGLRPVNREQR